MGLWVLVAPWKHLKGSILIKYEWEQTGLHFYHMLMEFYLVILQQKQIGISPRNMSLIFRIIYLFEFKYYIWKSGIRGLQIMPLWTSSCGMWRGRVVKAKSFARKPRHVITLNQLIVDALLEINFGWNLHKLWFCYVEDTFIVWQHGEAALKKFLCYLKSIEDHSKFIVEFEADWYFRFLMSS